MPETAAAQKIASWTIERLDAGGLDALAAFQQRAYADQFHAGFFSDLETVRRRLAWQYRGSSAVWVMRRGDAILGQLAIVPVDLTINGRSMQGGWCQDFIVAPEHRQRGAGVWLLREAVRDAGSTMPVILAGGTNDSSHPIFKCDGFEDMGMLPRAVGVAPAVRWWATGFGQAVRVEPGGAEDIEAWWLAHGPSYAACARRDRAWWDWRFAKHPHWQYHTWTVRRDDRVAGYLVLRSAAIRMTHSNVRTCWIVETAAEDRATARALMGRAARHAARLGCRVLRCDVQDPQLAWQGLWPVASHSSILIKVMDRQAVGQMPPLSSWFLSAADSDFDLYEVRG